MLQLEFGPRAAADPTPFAASLQLDHGVQQDGSEFLKLLLTKMECVFGASSQPVGGLGGVHWERACMGAMGGGVDGRPGESHSFTPMHTCFARSYAAHAMMPCLCSSSRICVYAPPPPRSIPPLP